MDGKIGDWPMSEYKILTSIDRNPGVPKEQNLSFIFIASPEASTKAKEKLVSFCSINY